LGIVSRKFPGNESKELFSGNSQEFPQILSTYSPVFCRIVNKKFPMELVTRKYLELVTRNSNWIGRYEKFLGMGYKKFLGPGEIPWNGLREIPLNCCRHLHRIFQ